MYFWMRFRVLVSLGKYWRVDEYKGWWELHFGYGFVRFGAPPPPKVILDAAERFLLAWEPWEENRSLMRLRAWAEPFPVLELRSWDRFSCGPKVFASTHPSFPDLPPHFWNQTKIQSTLWAKWWWDQRPTAYPNTLFGFLTPGNMSFYLFSYFRKYPHFKSFFYIEISR